VPTDHERSRFAAYLASQAKPAEKADKKPAGPSVASSAAGQVDERALADVCLVILCSNEFVYVD
ncbi:MAG TPA: hypothetical protein VF796_08840, partial [Humisphaera sp.]